jgi:hypothetical protein
MAKLSIRNSALAATLAVVSWGILAAAPAAAQVDFGLRASAWLEDSDPGVGMELVMPIGSSDWYFNPNVEAVFADDNDRLIGNLDVHYDFYQTSEITIWAGGGLALIHNDEPRGDQDEDEAGANILAGIGWKTGNVLPYGQVKVVVADDSELVAAIGIRF